MIAIFTPTRDTITAGTTYDIVQLIRADPNVVFALAQGTYLQNLRAAAAQMAIDRGMTHLLFIDSDMRFPPQTAVQLAGHRVPVVGANCRQRTQDAYTARKDGQFVDSTGRRGLSVVDSIGFGVTLINCRVFQKLPRPWFDMPYDPSTGKHAGEDVSFCALCRAHRIQIVVDHDLSQQVRHCGTVEF